MHPIQFVADICSVTSKPNKLQYIIILLHIFLFIKLNWQKKKWCNYTGC